MKASLQWLNQYLLPGGVTAQQADDWLTAAGFPIEEHVSQPDGDVMLDVEVTSNRGDCISHVGLAREIAACSGGTQRLVLPDVPDSVGTGSFVSDALTLENRTPEVCPLFTARLIRGCKVGPSPDWLVRCLEAIGQRSINNVVDVTNFITFEMGNPCHVFDLNKLAGGSLVVRFAAEGEKLTTLDDKPRVLKTTDLVVADSERPQSLAGVIGGADSSVDESTTDVVLEMATWDPVTIRTAARRMAIRTDAGFRFERTVDPRTIEFAARRAVRLIADLTEGEIGAGVLAEGAPMPEPSVVSLRPERCDTILGIPTPRADIVALMRSLEIEVENATGSDESGPLRCIIPPHRQDLPREIDLIEEVVRVRGYDDVPIREKLELRTRHPQEPERAVRELGSVLTGMGFYEAVTFSFVNQKSSELFMPEGLKPVRVDDERRGEEPFLRPSAVPSLLACRRNNQDARVAQPGGVRFFEISAVFAQTDANASDEHRMLTLIADAPAIVGKANQESNRERRQTGLRQMRGVVDQVVRAMGGPGARVEVRPVDPEQVAHRGYDPAASAEVLVDGDRIGSFGLVSEAALSAAGVDEPVIACELRMASLVAMFPPRTQLHPLPAFPPIQRDLSLILDEGTSWSAVDELVRSAEIELLTGWSFLSTFRGKPVGAGRKSVSLRLEFRDPTRTLRHEEVDPQVASVVDLAKDRLGAELRA